MDPKLISESTLIGRPRIKTNTSGIEFSVPEQFTSKFTKFTKEGGIDLKSSDKQIVSSDEKSDTEAKKSLPAKETIQEQGWKRIGQAPADFQHREKQQVEFDQRVPQKQGIFEEVLQAHKTKEIS